VQLVSVRAFPPLQHDASAAGAAAAIRSITAAILPRSAGRAVRTAYTSGPECGGQLLGAEDVVVLAPGGGGVFPAQPCAGVARPCARPVVGADAREAADVRADIGVAWATCAPATRQSWTPASTEM
jgi:hypothetical protein